MTRLPIRLWGDACLHGTAAPVGEITDDIRRLADDMTETMYDAPGRGLAAPQVGVSLRMFVMDCHWKDDGLRTPTVMIDPEIVEAAEDTASREEGCLSIPGVPVVVSRPVAVRMRWRTLDGAVIERRLEGIEAVCAQHEFDHLRGVTIVDGAPDAIMEKYGETLRALKARAERGETA